MGSSLSSPPQRLVSVGVPIRNGAATLRRALDSIVAQTYENLEIIISDNQSSDDTESICREYASRDPRVRYMRQSQPLTAVENFRAVADASHGEFFIWAAYDDLRDSNYVETLLRGLDRHPGASICFSEAAEFTSLEAHEAAARIQHRFQTLGLSFMDVVRQQTSTYCVHVYGLIRSSYLREYPWFSPTEGWDVSLLFWLAMRGPFVFEPGTTFTYFRPAEGVSNEQRALINNFRRLSFWWPEDLAWACAGAIADATRRKGEPIHRGRAFAVMYFHILQGWRGIVARWTPRPVIKVYRLVRPRRRAPASA